MILYAYVILLASVFFIPAAAAQTRPADRAARAVSETIIERHLRALAHDSMGGREAGTPDELRAARYIAAQYRRLGLQPGRGSSAYIQDFISAGHTVASRNGVKSQNVVGCIPGNGSATESAVLGAHYDAQGKTSVPNIEEYLAKQREIFGAEKFDSMIQANKKRNNGKLHLDSVKNGALDNASGVAAILSVAEALVTSSAKPRRDICFIAFGAEELGLLGSKAYVDALPDTASVVGMLNIDGANLWGATRDIAILGDDLSTLGADFRRAAAAESLTVTVHQREIEDNFFSRSDNISFALAGIPALFLRRGKYLVDGGIELWERRWADYYDGGRYHGYTDEILGWHSMAGVAQQARVAARVLVTIANASGRPTWHENSAYRKSGKARQPRP